MEMADLGAFEPQFNSVEVMKLFYDIKRKMAMSGVFMSIYTRSYAVSPFCLLQLGLALQMGLPIFFLVEEGVIMNDKLKNLVDGYEYFKRGEEDSITTSMAVLKMKMDEYLKNK